MVQAVKYNPEVGVIRGIDVTNGVPIGEGSAVVALEIKPNEIEKVNYLHNNSLATFRAKITLGSLTAIHFKISFYSKEVSTTETFSLISSTFQAGVETIQPNDIKIATSGTFSYSFPIQPCDGIKIIAWGEGLDNTGSKIELVHLAVRTE